MNGTFKRILVTSASLLLLAGVGASASQVVTPANASHISRKISYLHAKRSHDYKDIKSINTQLNKLEHNHIRRHSKRIIHHKSVGNWYVHHAKHFYLKYNNKSVMYDDGESDAERVNDGSNAEGMVRLNPHKYYNRTYHLAWVTTYANNGNTDDMGTTYTPSEANGGDITAYSKANRLYYSGIRHIKANHSHHVIYYHPNSNTWNNNDDGEDQ